MEPHDFAFFEKRKQDHISASLDEKNEAKGLSGLQDVVLYHDALPEINFENVELQSKVFGQSLETPFLVSSMTAGHRDSLKLNTLIARCCSRMGWLMGVGSQRRELDDESALSEWRKLKQEVPEVRLMGNIGLSQLAQSSQQIYKIQKLVDNMEAFGFFVHTNPLQECIQPEGTPQFADGIRSLTELCDSLNVPVVLKETGCGFSKKTLNKLKNTPLAAVDVSGLGGTHWGRIEGDRCQNHEILEETSRSFKDWGVSTVESV
ncbi:MAG: type 2 isopentenyl-diphosphate Delta-isomerase, partial [Bdellovibrionales bacterium]|nr:type 2 isopentenyl-diphosphate Delta-isomerase [Bdellovibrionales bacterium]